MSHGVFQLDDPARMASGTRHTWARVGDGGTVESMTIPSGGSAATIGAKRCVGRLARVPPPTPLPSLRTVGRKTEMTCLSSYASKVGPPLAGSGIARAKKSDRVTYQNALPRACKSTSAVKAPRCEILLIYV